MGEGKRISCHDVRPSYGPIRIKLMNITTKFRDDEPFINVGHTTDFKAGLK